jgi:hypothetical protein
MKHVTGSLNCLLVQSGCVSNIRAGCCIAFNQRVSLLLSDHCMAALPWGVVIVDESHNLRTTNARGADSPHTEAAVAAGECFDKFLGIRVLVRLFLLQQSVRGTVLLLVYHCCVFGMGPCCCLPAGCLQGLQGA